MRTLNRRDKYRVRWDGAANVKVLSMPGHKKCPKIRLQCTTTDLSYTGVRLSILADHLTQGLRSTDTAMPSGTTVKMVITFSKPRKKFVHLATLRWIRKTPGSAVLVMGFEFTDTPRKVMEAWKHFLEPSITQRRKTEEAKEAAAPPTVNVFMD